MAQKWLKIIVFMNVNNFKKMIQMDTVNALKNVIILIFK